MSTDYVLDNESVQFIIEAGLQTGEIQQLSQLLTAPQDFAERYSLTLTSNVKTRLLHLGSINQGYGFSPTDPTNNEAISFYNKVLIDGRYVQQWTTEPAVVAAQLGLTVSDACISRINEINVNTLVETDLITNPAPISESLVCIVIAVIIVIVLVFIPSCLTYNIQALVVDPSTMDKV